MPRRVRRDKSRASLDRRQRLALARKDRPSSRMGDLHLKKYGLSRKASQRFRRELKRATNRSSRHKAKEAVRNWQINSER